MTSSTPVSSDPAAPTTPIKVQKLGHVVYRVSDVERSTRFWTELMGFQVSDRNEFGMVFLRHGADHHSIALAPCKEVIELPRRDQLGFDHFAMEVASVRDLFAIRDFLRAQGVTILFDGRRGPGCNPGVEFLDPDGYMLELYAAMDQIGEDGRSRPPEEWRRANSLEEAVANPVPGVTY